MASSTVFATSLSISLLFTSTILFQSDPITAEEDIHKILPTYNLPTGVFPNTTNSYSLSSDGSLVVRLNSPCYIRFDDQLVYYDKLIKGRISYGSVSGVSGIQAKKLFIWVPVTGMDVDSESHNVEFHVGVLSQKLPADLFNSPHNCLDQNRGSYPPGSTKKSPNLFDLFELYCTDYN